MTDIILCASILSADFASLANQIHQVEEAGVDWIHVDVVDGHFAPNLTIGPFIVETVRELTHLPIDVHLMVDNPDTMVPWYAKAGADRITVHVEVTPDILSTFEKIRSLGCKPGVVLKPATPVETLRQALPHADLALVLTVNPGYSGQEFLPGMFEKISRVNELIRETGSHALIQVDGGIDAHNLPDCYGAGARAFVSASSIFKYPQGIAAGVAALREAVG